MKKNMIALLLSVVLAAGSIGGPAVYAAESGSTAEESEVVEADEFALDEKAVEIEEVSDDEAVESAEEEPAEEEPTEEEPAEEEPAEEESAAEDSAAAESTEPESAGDAAHEDDSAEAEERTEQEPGEKEESEILEETAADERNEAAGAIVASGTCGDNVIWELDEAGVMTVSGDGPMTDYTFTINPPWYKEYSDMITKIIIKEGVTNVGDVAFSGCHNLTEVTLPSSVTKIGYNAFYYCDALKDIFIPQKGLKEISYNAFASCYSLSGITLPSTLTTIGDNVFSPCFDLEEIIIPPSVLSIGNGAFTGSTSYRDRGLKRIYFVGDAPSMPWNVFKNFRKVTGYYPVNNETWTDVIKGSYASDCEFVWEPWDPVVPPLDLSICSISLGKSSYEYDGTEKKPSVIAKRGTKYLILNTDYTVEYSNNINSGTAQALITGIGKYTGTVTLEFTINNKNGVDISGAEILVMYDFEDEDHNKCVIYSGNPNTPVYGVRMGGNSLEENTDYTLTYKDNTGIGHAQCAVKGIGEYKGEFVVKFNVVPPQVKNLKGNNPLSTDTLAYANYRRGLDLKWDALNIDDPGYEIQYSKSADFTDKETVAVFTNEYSELEKPLERNCTYYVRVRAYQKSGNEYVNGVWSGTLKVKSGGQILSEEFFGMGNTDVAVNDLKKTDASFLKKVFDEGAANALFDFMAAEEKSRNHGDGKEISLGGGICYGMDVIPIAAIAYGLPSDLYCRESLYEIDSFSKARYACTQEFSISAEDMMRYAYFLQYSDEVSSYYYQYYRKADNPLLDLVNKVKACQKGTGQPPLICISEENDWEEKVNYKRKYDDAGHALVGIGIRDDNDSETVIEVYNPNVPGKHWKTDSENKQNSYSLHITKQSGQYTGWYFNFGNKGKGYSGDLSSRSDILNDDALFAYDFDMPLNALRKITNGIIPYKGEQKNILWERFHWTDRKVFDFTDEQLERLREEKKIFRVRSVKELSGGDSDEGDAAVDLYYTTLDEIPLLSLEDGDVIGMSSGRYYVKALAGGNTDCTIGAASDLPGRVVFTSGEDTEHTVIFSGRISGSGQTEQTTVKARVNEGNSGNISEGSDGSYTVSGVSSVNWTRNMGEPDNNGNVADRTPDVIELVGIDPDLSYRIEEKNENLVVSEDADGDGEYETVILTQEIAGVKIVASGDLTDTVSWKLDQEGVLTVYGHGEMPDFLSYEIIRASADLFGGEISEEKLVPWYSQRKDINEIVIDNGITSIGEYAFESSPNCNAVKISESVRKIGDHAFEHCEALADLTWHEGIEHIGDYAFSSCYSLADAAIPSGVTYLGQKAFAWCYRLERVTIPDSVEECGQYLFQDCMGLTDVTLGSGMTIIPMDMFMSCTALNGITIPEGVEVLDDSAFYRCTSLISIELPKSLKKVNEDAFYECSNLENVVYKGTKAQWRQVQFESGNTDLRDRTIHCTDGDLTVSRLGKTTRGDMFNLANNVKVTWKEVTGAKYYKVYREGITDPKETRKDPVIVTERLIGWDKEPGLTNGHAYRYKIVASLTGKDDSSGDSTLSYSKLMYRLKTVVIRSVKNNAPGKVTVKYDKTTSGDSYVLQYSERQDMVGAKTKVVQGASNTTCVISGLQKGKTYYVSIRVRKKVNGINYYTTFGVPKKVAVTR